MIIKAKPLPHFFFRILGLIAAAVFRTRTKRLEINAVKLKPGHSYIFMCNHFSFWDGFWAFYVCNRVFLEKGMNKLFIMSVKKQMEKNKWMRYMGSFSIEPGKRSIKESFEYAAEVLSEPGNMLLFYPQGNLETCYIRYIKFDEGIYEIIPQIKGDCQLIWATTMVEYFESLNPTITSTMLDCGTNHDFDFDELKLKVNQFHIKTIEDNIRFTDEPIKYDL